MNTLTTNNSLFSSSSHTGDDSKFTFDLSFVPRTSNPRSFLVAIDGVLQSPDAYMISVTPAQVTFTSAPSSGLKVKVIH